MQRQLSRVALTAQWRRKCLRSCGSLIYHLPQCSLLDVHRHPPGAAAKPLYFASTGTRSLSQKQVLAGFYLLLTRGEKLELEAQQMLYPSGLFLSRELLCWFRSPRSGPGCHLST